MNSKLKYPPTKDEIFKRIFGTVGNEDIAKSFIEEILGTKIETVTLDHKLELYQNHPEDKKW